MESFPFLPGIYRSLEQTLQKKPAIVEYRQVITRDSTIAKGTKDWVLDTALFPDATPVRFACALIEQKYFSGNYRYCFL